LPRSEPGFAQLATVANLGLLGRKVIS
jgi:hypothetical protein